MKILGISGSPRAGNTEWMVKTVLGAINNAGIETELILLRKLDVKLCTGCLTCEAGGNDRKGICKLQDDMNAMYPKILAADGLVLGTPAYFELLSGLLKNFIDRTCPIWPKLEGKYMAGVAVAEEGIGAAIENLKTYASLCKMPWVGDATTLAKTPKQALQDKDLEKELELLGQKFARVVVKV
jgi:multimeric flavodoxin WrbA